MEVEAGGELAPKGVDAVAVSDGDQSGAAIDGLGVDLGEERVDEVWAEMVLVIIADQGRLDALRGLRKKMN